MKSFESRFGPGAKCPQGHVYTEANTYVDKQGYANCKRCATRRVRKHQKANT